MSGILRVKDLNRGHVLKQGDKTELRYGLYDADGDTPNLAGKPVEVVFMTPDFKQKATVTETTVGDDNVVSFTIDGNLPNGKYYYEFVVGIEGNQQIYPSEHRQYFTVTPSSLESVMNVIQMVGFEELSETIIEQVQVDVDIVLALVEQAELGRQAQEEARETAEGERVGAESGRVTAEQQRVTADAEREAKLTAKADKTYVDVELEKKANRKQEEWITPTLLNGATSDSQRPFKYMKDNFGFVHFQSDFTNESTAQPVIILPAGYRPEYNINFEAYPGYNMSLWSNGGMYVWSGPLIKKNINHVTFKAVD